MSALTMPHFVQLHARDDDISDPSSSTTKTFTTALWLNAAIFGIEILAFTLLRPRFRSVYEPRSVLLPEGKRSGSLGSTLLAWPLSLWRSDPAEIRAANGLDAYFFVRFLRMVLFILVPIWIISWIVLLPVTSVNTGVSGKQGLDRFTFGNVGLNDQSRYAAHLLLAWLFTFWTLYILRREFVHFIHTRHSHLSSNTYSASPRARTLLITGVPAPLLNPAALRALYRDIPGGVKQVWVNRDLGTLPKELARRDKAINALEGAEFSLIKAAAKQHFKLEKAEAKKLSKEHRSPDIEARAVKGSGGAVPSELEALVPANKRPSKRMPLGFLPFSLPFMGKKVDKIEWARTEAAEAQANLAKGRAALRQQIAREAEDGASAGVPRTGGITGVVGKVVGKVSSKAGAGAGAKDAELGLQGVDPAVGRPNQGALREVDAVAASATVAGDGNAPAIAEGEIDPPTTYAPLGSAFILFASARAAHMAAQLRAHHAPARVTAGPAATDVAPEDVIWGNLGLNPYECQVRRLISYSATAALIIFWAIPVAFVGFVSNVAELCQTYSWLAWLCKIPPTVLGIIQGILPPVLLAVLMMLLPIVLRLLARFEGMTRKTAVERSLMGRYFMFQVIHSFLIVTLASGIIAALPQLVNDPTSIPTILANRLPQASTFFLTYVVLQGLSGAASSFLQAVTLVLYYVKLHLLGSTPRQIYTLKHSFGSVSWGTLFPATTLIVVITITYSIISPIINGLAVLTFGLFYYLYKYLFTYSYAQPLSLDTGGLFFPRALQHVFVGLYLQQICLAALFFLTQNASGKQSAIPEGALMVVLIGITACFHYVLNTMYAPLVEFLPLSLANRVAVEGPAAAAGANTSSGRANNAVAPGTGAVPASLGEKSRGQAGGYDVDGDDDSYDELDKKRKLPVDSAAKAGDPAGLHANTNAHHITNDNNNNIDGPVLPTAEENEMSPHDFTHPAVHAAPAVIWLPADALGFAEGEVAGCRAVGIDAAADARRAVMDERGKVQVEEGAVPPGEEEEEL